MPVIVLELDSKADLLAHWRVLLPGPSLMQRHFLSSLMAEAPAELRALLHWALYVHAVRDSHSDQMIPSSI